MSTSTVRKSRGKGRTHAGTYAGWMWCGGQQMFIAEVLPVSASLPEGYAPSVVTALSVTKDHLTRTRKQVA